MTKNEIKKVVNLFVRKKVLYSKVLGLNLNQIFDIFVSLIICCDDEMLSLIEDHMKDLKYD